MKTTNPNHLGSGGTKVSADQSTFNSMLGNMVTNGVNQVNDLQQHSFTLNQAFITDPDSVDSHDVTIAMREANMALQITKAVVDKAITAYREIINLR
ncbi:MAG: flagellar hook-basal body complex protein FliE [Spirochaetales bacterium]|nr:flagellar hook-basal body complex protein FliE [Spirochaetales bacterium]